ncbi:hypothetical protein TeGR_g13928 [Tetraparma gracilis]|uniref:Methyltransferase type 11 domain-containing protein n=1 Tax=Tetraparma gracilis TaxID=2962635 RepID=A0ABQ6N5A9_9STRA|nr:hypothetical protein TeGR_g13928 [Tetraparma gracilis]
MRRRAPPPAATRPNPKAYFFFGFFLLAAMTLVLLRPAPPVLTSVPDLSLPPPLSRPAPPAAAVALPSVRVGDAELPIDRKIYGGKGDKKHLGGFTDLDLQGISPSVWKLMLSYFGVRSLLDVGCGKGVSTSWFHLHGVAASCVEGSHDAVLQSLMPEPARQVVEHDFSRGPWWPPNTVDAVWCVEFTEHVGRNFQPNYLPAFKRAALVFVSHSHWGGWHHVEVHDDKWWRTKFELQGLVYSEEMTRLVRQTAKDEKGRGEMSFNGKDAWNAQHLYTSMQVFLNPAVASLPEHAHLMAEDGCFKETVDGVIYHLKCGTKKDGSVNEGHTIMDPAWEALQFDDEMDLQWEQLVLDSLKISL